MSLIGGYFCLGGRWQEERVRGKLRSFTAFRGDSPESYKYVVLPFQFGHIFARYKGTGPVQFA